MEHANKLFFHGTPVTLVADNMSSLEYAKAFAKETSASNRDDPFFVCDVGQLLRKHEQWTKALPNVHPYYAVKCNNNTLLLNTLAQLGCNFDCASKGEIDQVLSLGVEPDRIIFANPCKTASHIRHAAARGVRMMTFDNENELYKIQRLHPEAEMVLRIAVSDPTAVCQLNMKFGCEPVSTASALLKLAAVLNVQVVGISFHVGSGARDSTAFANGIAHAKRLFAVGKELGHKMRLLDLGGGYPGYEHKDITFQQIANTINSSLATNFPAQSSNEAVVDEVHVIGEPGRFFAASPFLLCANIIAKTRVPAHKITGNDADDGANGFMYYINDGVYGSFNCILFDHWTPTGRALFEEKAKPGSETWCSVWGPTCDSMDCVYKSYRLPELGVGEWLVFDNMGAYTMAAASDFNGFQKPSVNYIVHPKDWELLNRSAAFCFVSEADNGCMSDDSGVPLTSDDDDTCSVASSAPDSICSASEALENIEIGE